MLRIIRANHEHEQVGRYIIHRAILQTPKDMLRTVSAKTEVERLIVSEIIIPNILAFGFPPMGDGIAQQDNLYRLLRLLNSKGLTLCNEHLFLERSLSKGVN